MTPPRNHDTAFHDGVRKTIRFLEAQNIDYFLLGGLAVGALGEAPFTYDLDLDIFLPKEKSGLFLKAAQRAFFRVKTQEALSSIGQFGTCRIFYGDLQIDLILASTDLETSALKRRKRHALFGIKAWFPSPEDLILLKLIPGRAKDLIDAESVILRHKGKLDASYLEKWAKRIADEAEDFRVLHQLRRLLKS